MTTTMKAFIAAIAGVGVVRFILTMSGVPNDVVKYFSMTAVMIVGSIYFAIATKTHKERLKAAYLLVLPYMAIEVIALGYTWVSGHPTIFHAAEYSFGTSIAAHTIGHLVGGLTWEPLFFFLMMEIIWLIYSGGRSLLGEKNMPTPEELVAVAVEKVGVPYELIEIDPAYADTAAFCEKYGYSADQTCNTIIVASKREPKKFVACVVLAHTRLDVNKRVTKLMGVPKASFASAEEMTALTGMQVGGVTPFSLPSGVPLYIDDRIPPLDWVILGGGGRSLKIKISPEVFPRLGAEVVAGLGI